MAKQVKRLAEELRDLDLNMEALTAQMEALKTRRKEIVEQELPTAMRAQQVHKSMDTMIGNRAYKLDLRHKIVGSLSRAPDIDAALKYLEEKGFKGASNATISVTVVDEDREDVLDKLNGVDGTPKVERKINHNTLAAFARECLANGDGFDLEKVGLTSLIETTIKEID